QGGGGVVSATAARKSARPMRDPRSGVRRLRAPTPRGHTGTASVVPSGGGDPGRLSSAHCDVRHQRRRRVTSPARATQASVPLPRSSPGGASALRYIPVLVRQNPLVPRLSLERNHGPRLERPGHSWTSCAEDGGPKKPWRRCVKLRVRLFTDYRVGATAPRSGSSPPSPASARPAARTLTGGPAPAAPQAPPRLSAARPARAPRNTLPAPAAPTRRAPTPRRGALPGAPAPAAPSRHAA